MLYRLYIIIIYNFIIAQKNELYLRNLVKNFWHLYYTYIKILTILDKLNPYKYSSFDWFCCYHPQILDLWIIAVFGILQQSQKTL